MNAQPTPPHGANRLLEWFCAPHLLEEVQGDLHERFIRNVTLLGATRARQQYGREVLSFLRPFALKRQPREYPSFSLLSPAMLQNYIKIALRNLARNKAYSAINIIGLSIGLAAAMLIMLYTKDEVSYDRFHKNNPAIYRITSQALTPAGNTSRMEPYTGYLPGPKFHAGVPEIKAFVRYQEDRKDMKQGNEVRSQTVYSADASFFSVFTFPLLGGNPKTALQNPRSVVISEKMAETHFGTTDAVGKTLFFKNDDNFQPYVVTAVAKNCPQNSSIKFDVLMPMIVSQDEMANSENWFSVFMNTFIVLSPGANLNAVQSKMNQVYVADASESIVEMAKKYGITEKTQYALQSLTDMHLSKELPASNGLVDESNPTFSYILSGIALFILLIACINFVNLTVARSLKRAKEIGVRKVVGGARSHLIIQFLGESFLLCFVAFVFALALVGLALPTFNQLANKALSLAYLFDTRLVLAYMALFIATSLLAGFYPALVLSGYSPVATLYSRFNLSGKSYLQKSLVVLQFSLASFLIIASLTIYSQFNFLTSKDLGYEDKNVVIIDKSNLKRSEAKLFKEELLKNPNIVDVAPKNGGRWGTVAKVNGETQLNFEYETINDNYLPLFKIPILTGRNFSTDFPSDSSQSVLVNETFVNVAGWKKPIGQVVDFWFRNEKYTVIGVVKDYHYESLNQTIKPQLFTMNPRNSYGRAFIKLKPNTETASLHYIENVFKKLFPLHPYSYQFLDQENIKRYESEAKWKQMMLFGAILTIFISCIGLFGLATLSAERRTKEIGIRKVLGASVSGIVQLLSTDFLRLVSLSFVFAFPAAWYAMGEWLKNYPYRIDISVWMFALTACIAISIAFLTVGWQSLRAAMTNPVTSLKSE
ncbi:ABC transporter permease [Spirosoma utsteinense]|uniref:ABC transport system permease protein n=1 Tax=Spirosoma utsteinense TaxID=2585773 RepID=A0ABR6W219_9BACT|nr:ABC transporter permease [Spirosoma utsteinense]MBC3785953.1 putative ABC transport system permease protein [Spirosoma utsteinense]MBC3790651.1 putative ABC transport system permease protein [Spirosoma utsteinense]